ncbi:hypothetical protein EVAR_43951_1 [Eumeta japonica]|uniref:Uncharacterized protein n=1 Tax=Eumeta variegata TaxID=151549 RepID=A0A4C1XZG7_EUMVA|nr:hypothetical protein EVAR_43951_1 [Eumeta japonica]
MKYPETAQPGGGRAARCTNNAHAVILRDGLLEVGAGAGAGRRGAGGVAAARRLRRRRPCLVIAAVAADPATSRVAPRRSTPTPILCYDDIYILA